MTLCQRAVVSARVLALGVASLIAACRETAPPPANGPFTQVELATLESLSQARLEPARDPSNRVFENPQAAELGRLLFFDARLSRNGELSCASCHQPERAFSDGRATAVGVGDVGRNTPTVLDAAHLHWFYWDGRRDSLWSQALLPLEAPAEMGNTRLGVVRLIESDPEYERRYEALFGALPSFRDDARYPEHGGPFAAPSEKHAWDKLVPVLRSRVNTVFANVGKAIASYERLLVLGPSRFDELVSELRKDPSRAPSVFSAEEVAGAKLFLDANRTQCLNCHNGPLFTNGGFHNIGTGSFAGPHLDFGRVFGLRSLELDEFRCDSAYSDAPKEACGELVFLNRSEHVPLEGAFKVPGLRNVAETAPYMHDGRFATLDQVLDHYTEARVAGDRTHELRPFQLSPEERKQLIAFLRTLSAKPATDARWLTPPSRPAPSATAAATAPSSSATALVPNATAPSSSATAPSSSVTAALPSATAAPLERR